jgi:hypothetical protein
MTRFLVLLTYSYFKRQKNLSKNEIDILIAQARKRYFMLRVRCKISFMAQIKQMTIKELFLSTIRKLSIRMLNQDIIKRKPFESE